MCVCKDKNIFVRNNREKEIGQLVLTYKRYPFMQKVFNEHISRMSYFYTMSTDNKNIIY